MRPDQFKDGTVGFQFHKGTIRTILGRASDQRYLAISIP